MTVLILIVSTAILGFLTAPSLASATPSTEGRIFTVIVSRYGFNGTSGTFSITVQQGDSVKITFVYGDNDLTVDNPHAIMIDGYRIQTVNIGKSNPSVTVEFVADVSGTFNLYCYIPCLGMEHLLGHLIVSPAEGQRIPTTLDLAVSSVNPESTSFKITAMVRDENGQAIIGAPVSFYENTTFGRLFLGTMPTDSEGVAILNYNPSRTGIITIVAENPGTAQYADSSKSIPITIASGTTQAEGKIYLGLRQPSQRTGLFYGITYPPNLSMIGVPTLTNILAVIVASIVVLGVWSTYGYVVRQIANLPKYGEISQAGMQRILPEATPPIDIYRHVTVDSEITKSKILSLFLVGPILGAANAILLNDLSMPILWNILSLLCLAILETTAIVIALTRSRSAN